MNSEEFNTEEELLARITELAPLACDIYTNFNGEVYTIQWSWRTTAPAMLHQNYDALSLEEKVKRLENNAILYLGWIGHESPERAFKEDCTRYWEEMQKAGEGR